MSQTCSSPGTLENAKKNPRLQHKTKKQNTGAHLELCHTQAPTPCDCISTRVHFNCREFPNGQPNIYQDNQI